MADALKSWLWCVMLAGAWGDLSGGTHRSTDPVASILRLHAIEREGHLKGDANLVSSVLADSVVSIQNGDVEVRSRDQMRRGFAEYFSAVAYASWEDIIKPLVHISRDGGMAWSVIRIRAQFREKSDPSGKVQEFTSSWIATYEKNKSGWHMSGISSGCDPPCGPPPESSSRE
ncbi:MAG: nuclear transport factor 2 family protein [Acidobacteriaceae bacterium]|nr:nuclear transport factor 2 family protein [Acidobacteriaceae bacterium]MBV9781684.1 nuclear transport factor 2 family protein [Acidobacteriaceae bacterium]